MLSTVSTESWQDFGDLAPVPTKYTMPRPSCPIVRPGDIVLCIRTIPIGDRNWSDNLEYCLGRGVAGAEGQPPSKVALSQAYLWHWLDHAAPVLSAKGRGRNVSSQVSKADIASLQIPLPPLAEQRRIAGILDAADALRAKRREALAQLDTLLQSTFLDMFGDPVTNPDGVGGDAFRRQSLPIRRWLGLSRHTSQSRDRSWS